MVKDGLKRTNMRVGNLYGDNISGAAFADTNGGIVSSATGSPSTFGAFAQAGVATIGAGSEVWIVYGTAYSAAPTAVMAQYGDHELGYVSVGSITAGSALAIGATASKDITWMALG